MNRPGNEATYIQNTTLNANWKIGCMYVHLRLFSLPSSPGVALCAQPNKDPVRDESGTKIKDLHTETDQPDTGWVQNTAVSGHVGSSSYEPRLSVWAARQNLRWPEIKAWVPGWDLADCSPIPRLHREGRGTGGMWSENEAKLAAKVN